MAQDGFLVTPLVPPPIGAHLQGGEPESSALRPDLPTLDTSGMSRAIEMLERGQLGTPAVVAVLTQQLSDLARQAAILHSSAQNALVELRALRESKEQVLLAQRDAARSLQDANDRFVAELISDHEACVREVKRERDVAMERVRELSRGVSRVGALSTAGMRRVSIPNLSAPTAPTDEVGQLKAQLDELRSERERSLKLLRQLAEQRDQAEARLHEVVSASALHARNELHQTTEPTPKPMPPSPETHAAPTKPLEASVEGHAATSASPLLTGPDRQKLLPVQPSANVPHGAQGTETLPFDEGLDWDLSSPPPTTDVTLPRGTENASDLARAPQQSIPLLRKKTNPMLERAGVYSITSGELPVEEIVLVRGPGQVRRDG